MVQHQYDQMCSHYTAAYIQGSTTILEMVTARESSIGLAMSWQERFAALGAAVKLLLLKEESHKRKMVVGFHLEAIN